MKNQDYTVSITVNATAREAFNGINKVSEWWTENLEGSSQKLNDEFTVRFGDVHVSTQKLVEVVRDKKVVWLVTDSHLNFIKNKHEWTGSRIVFEIVEKDNKTNGIIENADSRQNPNRRRIARLTQICQKRFHALSCKQPFQHCGDNANQKRN